MTGELRTVRVSGSTGRHDVQVSLGAGPLPVDAQIPALAAVRRRGIAAVLHDLGLEAAAVDDVALLKYHAGKRCTFYARAADGGVAIKAYAADPAPVAGALMRLARRGLASGHAPTATPLIGWDRRLRLLVTAWFDAPSAIDLIAAARGVRAGELAATWLHRTAGLRDERVPSFPTTATLRRASSRARLIARLDRRLGSRAACVVATLARTAPADGSLTLAHGSLYAAHVFDLGTGPGVIDWDHVRLAPPALDAGTFAATVTLLALVPALRTEASAALSAFSAGVRDVVAPGALEWYRTAALLSLVRRIAGRREGDWRADGAALLADSRLDA